VGWKAQKAKSFSSNKSRILFLRRHRDTEENKVKTGGHRGCRGHRGVILRGISVPADSVRENRRGLRRFWPLVVQRRVRKLAAGGRPRRGRTVQRSPIAGELGLIGGSRFSYRGCQVWLSGSSSRLGPSWIYCSESGVIGPSGGPADRWRLVSGHFLESGPARARSIRAVVGIASSSTDSGRGCVWSFRLPGLQLASLTLPRHRLKFAVPAPPS
jgi:hypothetical protein